MTTDKLITELKATLNHKEKNQSVLKAWLLRNWQSEDRLKIISDINALSVEIATTKYKIDNLMRNAPILGLELPDEITITEKSTKQI